MSKPIVGGGGKKVLYTLATAQRIGLRNSARALRANNTCKACGLGMGGQRGGMVNEEGEFPSVCNKSVQAQSTDIQPPIPEAIFRHPLGELRELSGRELEQLGRLNTPLHKAAGDDRFQPIDWDVALQRAAAGLAAADPARSFFYSSGRSSNEAGFLLQLLARLYGTNNVTNCSYYCHQATGVGLGSTIGTGTATVELADLNGCDLVFLIGANPASNHPRLLHKLRNCRRRGGHVIVINPARESGLVRFAVPKSPRSMLSGGDWIASQYLQPRIGSDVAVFKALAKAVLERGAEDAGFIADHTEGFDAWRDDIDAHGWDELLDACGLTRTEIDAVAARYAEADNAVFAWGMGMTHHLHGVENVELIANLAMLRGMLGRPHAGLLPLRGHSNVQGVGTIGVKPVLAEEVFAKMEAEFGVTLPRAPGLDTLSSLEQADAGNIEAALMMGGNLYAATPDSAFAARALDCIPFKLYLTTTLNTGHVHGVDGGEVLILPVTARDEEPQPTTQESMFNYVRMSDGGIGRLDNVRSEVRILADLAARLVPGCGIDFGAFAEHREIRQAIAHIVPGMQDLADIDVARREFTIRGRILHRPEFNTPSGRAQFVVRALPAPAADEDFPYTLMTFRSEGQFNTIIYEDEDVYRGIRGRWCVMMNQEDMSALALQPGDRVDLVSATGRMRDVRARPLDLPRGDVAAYFPEANVLCERRADPRSRTPNFKSVPVRIEMPSIRENRPPGI